MLSTKEKAKKSVYRDLNLRLLGLRAPDLPTVLIFSALIILLAVAVLVAVALSPAIALSLAEAVAKIFFRCQ